MGCICGFLGGEITKYTVIDSYVYNISSRSNIHMTTFMDGLNLPFSPNKAG
jgi:hypothetical protein